MVVLCPHEKMHLDLKWVQQRKGMFGPWHGFTGLTSATAVEMLLVY